MKGEGKKISLWRNEEGSSMVEAAVVLPIVLLTLVAMLYLMVFMLEQVTASSLAQVTATTKAGARVGNYEVMEGRSLDVGTSGTWTGVRKSINVEKTVALSPAGLLHQSHSTTLSASTYAIDEQFEIR